MRGEYEGGSDGEREEIREGGTEGERDGGTDSSASSMEAVS